MRLRLLPLLMFALVATTTVKLGSVWNAFEISVGTETMAQTQPAQPERAPVAETATAAEPNAPAMEPEPAPGAEAADGNLAAQEPVVPDPFDYTDEEVDVLQQLAKRREALELRARQLDEREALIQAAEQRMDQKMGELKALQALVEDLLKKRSDEQEGELRSLVKVYENMKPKDAARIFEELDMDTLLLVAERMKERSLAPIMANMDPSKARDVTVDLARRRQLPQSAAAGG
jgi:flagellar motility protein MotE (MotC chaperone)